MKSVFLGEPVGEVVRGVAVAGIPQGLPNPPTHVPNVDEVNERLHREAPSWVGPTPGTAALVGTFLAAFVVYYFTNWKLLSVLWKVG